MCTLKRWMQMGTIMAALALATLGAASAQRIKGFGPPPASQPAAGTQYTPPTGILPPPTGGGSTNSGTDSEQTPPTHSGNPDPTSLALLVPGAAAAIGYVIRRRRA
jgi:hypothetical protein